MKHGELLKASYTKIAEYRKRPDAIKVEIGEAEETASEKEDEVKSTYIDKSYLSYNEAKCNRCGGEMKGVLTSNNGEEPFYAMICKAMCRCAIPSNKEQYGAYIEASKKLEAKAQSDVQKPA